MNNNTTMLLWPCCVLWLCAHVCSAFVSVCLWAYNICAVCVSLMRQWDRLDVFCHHFLLHLYYEEPIHTYTSLNSQNQLAINYSQPKILSAFSEFEKKNILFDNKQTKNKKNEQSFEWFMCDEGFGKHGLMQQSPLQCPCTKTHHTHTYVVHGRIRMSHKHYMHSRNRQGHSNGGNELAWYLLERNIFNFFGLI